MMFGDLTYEQIIYRLKEYRLDCNLNQTEFAAKIGVSQSFYSDVENGNNLISYTMLNGMYQADIDIDRFFLNHDCRCENNLLLDIIENQNDKKAEVLYAMMITCFIEFWDWELDSIFQRCLYSELKAMILLHTYDAGLNLKLYYLRSINRLSQQDLADLLDVGRTKCGQCENGKKTLDIESIRHLYNEGYTLPSFFFESYVGIEGIAYLLEQDFDKKKKFYYYIDNVLTNIIGSEKALSILRDSGVI